MTRAGDIAAVASQLELFSADRSWYLNYETDGMTPLEALSTTLLGMQPPRHTQVRSLLGKAFVPRTVSALEGQIRSLTTKLIDGVIERGECDLVADIAVPLPIVVIAKLLGFPDESVSLFHDWSLRFVATQDPEVRGGGAEETARALEEISAYVNEIADLRRDDPRDDLLTVLAHAEIDGANGRRGDRRNGHPAHRCRERDGAKHVEYRGNEYA
ncbi:hypothetical protein [Rhodococcus sp. IEGM 1305]|uniref:hypothetical protein n=1 Tax=Rhodococcus sp. IEGM 1305 TaxID=3047092 RepID=UPI0024B64E95|nr:hypothetical protein [Rhodococcus sp. IEGM 1305]MDI9953632.1 hypothetical protein [Rhodococcus sp. IEGM 1305]